MARHISAPWKSCLGYKKNQKGRNWVILRKEVSNRVCREGEHRISLKIHRKAPTQEGQ